MAKKSGIGKNKDVKATGIIVLLLMVGIGAFLWFNRDQQMATKPTANAKQNVVSPVKVQPTVVKTKPVVDVKIKPTTPVLPTTPTPVKVQPITPVAPGSAGKIAFIIDDWGQSTHNCQYLKDIKDPVTVAILPSLRHTDDVAKCAKANGKTVILHLPLQAYHNYDPYPSDYIIKTDMKPAKVVTLLNEILLKMPYIEGVNNHMGSKATEDSRLMGTILKSLKNKGYFFIDSMTAPNHSVCKDIAKQLKLPFARRDVFLDNVNTREAITKQFAELVMKAKRQGSAIAIGHDRPLTMQILKEQIELLKAQGFTIVDIKQLIKTQ